MSQYRYATDSTNYEDFAAGRVLYNRPGATSFPVRLASEIFGHCAHLLDNKSGYHVYDPCCGTGYLLAVLGFLHGAEISTITAADSDPQAVEIAARNLGLLSPEGMEARRAQLRDLAARFDKPSHHDALRSVTRLAELLRPHIALHTLTTDATHAQSPHPVSGVDMLITDVPYGRVKHWQGVSASLPALLAAQHPTLRPDGIAAIVTPKDVTVQHPAYRRMRRFTLGKRQITLLSPG